MKKYLFVYVFLFNFPLLFAEPIYKEIVKDGEKVYKWVKEISITEYDSNGNKIHSKDSYGNQEWYEYDSKGNKIHYKGSDGYENWYEYDSNGNEIHSKDSYGYEEWYEYDSKGNKIHYKDSDGYEEWYEYEYDSEGNILKKTSYSLI